MKKIQASPNKIEYENPRDIQLFSKTVSGGCMNIWMMHYMRK